MKASTVASLLFFAASAAAHATWQQIWVNGVDGGTSCLRRAASNSPVTSVSSPDLACNVHTNSPNLCNVKPGDTVTVEMHQQHNDRSCSNEAIGGAHHGPVTIYMAQVSDARTAVASSADWFKIHERGLVSTNPAYWADQVLNDNCGHYTFTIPDVAPGNYLLRAEELALHTAGGSGGAQFYPGCFQLNVSGNGSAKPPTIKIPGAFSASDPGILINIYQNLQSYPIPGPRPYGYSAPPPANTPYPTTATWNTANQPTSAPTFVPPINGGDSGTVQPPVTTQPPGTTQPPVTQPPTTPQPTGALQTQWGQCGGTGWTGPTQCVAPYTCTEQNAYYSQCS